MKRKVWSNVFTVILAVIIVGFLVTIMIPQFASYRMKGTPSVHTPYTNEV